MPYTQCLEREVEADCKNEFCFRPFTLETKELIESYTKPWQMDCSDLSFANLFIWGTEGKMEFAEKNNVLYVKLDFEGVPVYFWAPIPKKGADVDYRKCPKKADRMERNYTETSHVPFLPSQPGHLLPYPLPGCGHPVFHLCWSRPRRNCISRKHLAHATIHSVFLHHGRICLCR